MFKSFGLKVIPDAQATQDDEASSDDGSDTTDDAPDDAAFTVTAASSRNEAAAEGLPPQVVTPARLQEAINTVLTASDLLVKFAMPAAVKRYTMTTTKLTSITLPPAPAKPSAGQEAGLGTRATIRQHAAPEQGAFNMSTLLPESENRWVVLEFEEPDHAYWARLILAQALTLECGKHVAESAQEWLELKSDAVEEKAAAVTSWKEHAAVVALANLVRHCGKPPTEELPGCAACAAAAMVEATKAAKEALSPDTPRASTPRSPSFRLKPAVSFNVVCEPALPEYKRCAARCCMLRCFLFLTHQRGACFLRRGAVSCESVSHRGWSPKSARPCRGCPRGAHSR